MNLGERIYNLRTQRNLSQGDLAEALEVSRQSISKWENNSAVPELDKLIRLSELFGVTLDELVKGEKIQEEGQSEPPQQTVTIIKKESMATRKLVGILLLSLAGLAILLIAILGGGLGGLLLALPLAMYGLVCLLVARHTGLWCGWVTWLIGNPFLMTCTSLRWNYIFDTFRRDETWFISWAHILWAWVIFAFMVLLVAATVLAYRKEPLKSTTRTRLLLCVIIYLLMWLPFSMSQEIVRVHWIINIIRSTVRLPLLAALLAGVARYLYHRKQA